MSTDRTRDHLAELLTAPLLAVGLDVEAVEITQAGRRRLLRVAVDKDGGVTMDDIADATREVSQVLDDSDVMGRQPYTLEVTSPGTDRPLVAAAALAPQPRPAGQGDPARRHHADRPGDGQRRRHRDPGRRRRRARGPPRHASRKAKVQIEFNRSPQAPEPVDGLDHRKES